MSKDPRRDCDRCGCSYVVRSDRPHTQLGLCPSCQLVEPEWPNVHVPTAPGAPCPGGAHPCGVHAGSCPSCTESTAGEVAVA